MLLTTPFVFSSEICTRSKDDIQEALFDFSNRISFHNTGGLFNGGVCWWHSRLQRSSVYLVKYVPDMPRPNLNEVKTILNSLRAMNKVVIIPGYSDFETFSKDYRKQIQEMLNDWQKSDGFFNFQWIRGISGKSVLPANEMLKKMNNIFDFYKRSPSPLWVMAQIKGVTSHSLLILDMKKHDRGYDLVVIDSNRPYKNVIIKFYEGDTSLRAEGENYSFVPYVGFQRDFVKIFEALKKNCGSSPFLNLNSILDGDIELNK